MFGTYSSAIVPVGLRNHLWAITKTVTLHKVLQNFLEIIRCSSITCTGSSFESWHLFIAENQWKCYRRVCIHKFTKSLRTTKHSCTCEQIWAALYRSQNVMHSTVYVLIKFNDTTVQSVRPVSQRHGTAWCMWVPRKPLLIQRMLY